MVLYIKSKDFRQALSQKYLGSIFRRPYLFNENMILHIYIYIYTYIYIYSGFLLQDLESSYSFGKIQRTVVCPIVFNTQFDLFNLLYLSYLKDMCIFIDKRCPFKPFSYENCCYLSAIKSDHLPPSRIIAPTRSPLSLPNFYYCLRQR